MKPLAFFFFLALARTIVSTKLRYLQVIGFRNWHASGHIAKRRRLHCVVVVCAHSHDPQLAMCPRVLPAAKNTIPVINNSITEADIRKAAVFYTPPPDLIRHFFSSPRQTKGRCQLLTGTGVQIGHMNRSMRAFERGRRRLRSPGPSLFPCCYILYARFIPAVVRGCLLALCIRRA